VAAAAVVVNTAAAAAVTAAVAAAAVAAVTNSSGFQGGVRVNRTPPFLFFCVLFAVRRMPIVCPDLVVFVSS
jgi:hypothetical protein